MEKIIFKKKYGQNFLSDTNLLKAIVLDSSVTQQDEVLEIGAGAGALTYEIAKSCKYLFSYEIDVGLKNILQEKLKEFNNVKIIFADVMKVKTKEIDNLFNGNYKIVANLPYYITSSILFKFLEESKKVESLTIMVQKEVGEKMTCNAKSSNYGLLTVMVQHYANVKITRIVKKHMFVPSPKVDSCIVHLNIKNIPYDKDFKKFVQTCFSMRRKTLVNNLSKMYKKELVQDKLNSLNYDLNVRAEELSPQEYELLYEKFRQN